MQEMYRAREKLPSRIKWLEDNRDRLLDYKKQHRRENIVEYKATKSVWEAINSDKMKIWHSKYHQARKHSQEYKDYCAKYNSENAEVIKETRKNYRERNKQRISEDQANRYQSAKDVRKAYASDYRKANQHKKNAWNASYDLAKIKRTPNWLTEDDKFLIHEIYHLATMRSKMTGISWEVDHIAPIQGKTVSGLHVPNNLQVIPAVVNNKKRNQFTPGDFPVKTNFFGD